MADSPYMVRVLVVGLLYYCGARLGLYLSFQPSNIGALWPPNAVLLVALLLQPRRRWWGYLLVALPAELAADLPCGISLHESVLFLMADYVEVLTAALLLGVVVPGPLRFNRLRETMAFVASAVVVAPFVAAFPGALAGGFDVASAEFWPRAHSWFLSDALTHIAVTPFLLLLFGGAEDESGPEGGRTAECAALGVLLIIGCLVLFGRDVSSHGEFHSLFYLPVPMLVWAAVRMGRTYSFGCMCTVALLAVWYAAQGRGPFGHGVQAGCVMDMQVALLLSLTPIAMLASLIAEHHNTARELRDSEEKYRLLVDHAGDMVVKMDRSGQFLYVSPEYCRVYGKSESELLGQAHMPLVHDDDHAQTEAAMGDVLSPPHRCYLEQRSATVRGWQWIAWRYTGIVSDKGSVESIVGVGRNIDSLKAAEGERQSLLRRLGQSEKMEALNLLAGGVAHDLNNILSGIITYPDLLLMDLPEDSNLREPLEAIRNSGFRAAAVVRDMVGLSRRRSAPWIPGNLSRILTEYLGSSEHEGLMARFPEVELVADLDAGILGVSCDPLHLRKAIGNLILNAVETLSPGGRVTVKTENRYIENGLVAYESIPAGEYAVLVVSDSAGEVAAEDLTRIFDPFYTRKVLGWGGTGLGLTVVWNVVHDHGGFIDVTSRVGEGTTFTLYFPGQRMAIPDASEVVSSRDYEGDGEHVLVVDDEPAQRDIAQHLLQRLMYRVDTVDSGMAALKHLQSQPVDLVILDMIMPSGMDGQETYAKLVDLQPGLKVVVASGFATMDTIEEMRRSGVTHYVEKPYTMVSLGRAVYEVLHQIPSGSV
ncbi:MAG: MASE1 domain-containing protein [Lentisphaerae bacterium]|nr:MASE1 domain-containing protein [Lentisphaerota bacterium]